MKYSDFYVKKSVNESMKNAVFNVLSSLEVLLNSIEFRGFK